MPEKDTVFIKSPLNYTGGKHKLLGKLVPLMPSDIPDMTFVDLFGGGGNVVANAPANYTHLFYNEFDENVFNLVSMIATVPEQEISSFVDDLVSRYKLNRENKDGYLALREHYNAQEEKDPRELFALVAHAFSNQIRFNRMGGFNLPFGKRTFNDSMRANLQAFCGALSDRDFTAICGSFTDFNFDELEPSCTLVYCDPPYLGSLATYNEHGGWTEKDEKELLDLLDELHSRGFYWILSNNFSYDNPLLKTWASSNEDYTVADLEYDYKNCSWRKNAARTAEAEAQGADVNENVANDTDAADDTDNAGDDNKKDTKPITEVAIVNFPIA